MLCKMCILENFYNELYKYLTGSQNSNSNIIRIHNRKLDKLGDLSFPIDIKSWFQYVNQNTVTSRNIPRIFDYLNSEENLIESKAWDLLISHTAKKNNDFLLYLDRVCAFNTTIREVLEQAEKYGSKDVKINKNIVIYKENELSGSAQLDLSSLKVKVIQNVTINLLKFTNSNVLTNEDSLNKSENNYVKLVFTQKSCKSLDCPTVLVGPVLNEKGQKDCKTTANDLYSKRTVDMRLMAEHKYGLRITSSLGWQDFFKKLGRSSVTIHLLQNKPQNSTTIKINDPSASNIKAASFILYNCARLSRLFKEFDSKVSANIYPSLPDVESIEFTLLTEPEEWELLFVCILQFPIVIKNCIKDVENGRINVHYLVSHLQHLASVFSIYYRRIRILMDPRDHLFPIIFERIYLLKALQQVLHIGLRLLDIEPVSQM